MREDLLNSVDELNGSTADIEASEACPPTA